MVDDQVGFELFEQFSTLVERAMKTLGVNNVEDVVLDFIGDGVRNNTSSGTPNAIIA